MKEDFEAVKGLVSIMDAVTALGLQRGKSNYYFHDERTPSIKIYEEGNSFYDFGRGIGGDVIKLWSHVRNTSQWQAVQEMREYFSISKPNKENRADIREKIRKQQAEQQARREAEQAKKKEWVERVEFLQFLLDRIEAVLANLDPFDAQRMSLYDEKAKINHELDCLVIGDDTTW